MVFIRSFRTVNGPLRWQRLPQAQRIRNFRTLRLCLLVEWILRWNWMYGPAETVTSESCLAVTVTFQAQLVNDSPPSVTGNPSTGNKLLANHGIWTGDPTFAYQWMLNGYPISGATLDSYKISSKDVGADLSIDVTASDGTNSVSAQSQPSK